MSMARRIRRERESKKRPAPPKPGKTKGPANIPKPKKKL